MSQNYQITPARLPARSPPSLRNRPPGVSSGADRDQGLHAESLSHLGYWSDLLDATDGVSTWPHHLCFLWFFPSAPPWPCSTSQDALIFFKMTRLRFLTFMMLFHELHGAMHVTHLSHKVPPGRQLRCQKESQKICKIKRQYKCAYQILT